MRLWIRLMAIVALVTFATPVLANPFVRENVYRSGTEKNVVIMITSAEVPEPQFVPLTTVGVKHFSGVIGKDSRILASMQSGKHPLVRGDREIEKRPLVAEWRILGHPAARSLALQTRQTEERKLNALKKFIKGEPLTRRQQEIADEYEAALEALRQTLNRKKLTEDDLKKHFLYKGVVEGVIHPSDFRAGDVIRITFDYDQHEDRVDADLVVSQYTTLQIRQLHAAAQNPAYAAQLQQQWTTSQRELAAEKPREPNYEEETEENFDRLLEERGIRKPNRQDESAPRKPAPQPRRPQAEEEEGEEDEFDRRLREHGQRTPSRSPRPTQTQSPREEEDDVEEDGQTTVTISTVRHLRSGDLSYKPFAALKPITVTLVIGTANGRVTRSATIARGQHSVTITVPSGRVVSIRNNDYLPGNSKETFWWVARSSYQDSSNRVMELEPGAKHDIELIRRVDVTR